MSDELIYLTATDALARFADKSLSPVELLHAQIDRAEAVNDAHTAFTFTHYDEALDLARAAEARWSKGEPQGTLDGLAVAIKDESEIAGKPTSNGSLIMRDFVADHTSIMNERILAEGGIVHARTATPEFSVAGFTWSRLWGVTRNPWNRDFTHRRIVGRVGGGAGLGDDDAGDGLGHWRVDPHSVFMLRCRGVQAALRAQPRRSAVQL